MRQSWYSHETVIRQSWDSYETVMVQSTVLLSVKRICRCCRGRHLGQSVTQNFRVSLHESNPCWMSLTPLDKGNLPQPSWPLLGKVKTSGQGCDFQPNTPLPTPAGRWLPVFQCWQGLDWCVMCINLPSNFFLNSRGSFVALVCWTVG